MDAVAGTGAREAFRPEIEGLRGIAILLVVAFHSGLVGLPGGFIGVDVFFVLSGFLITGSLFRERSRSGTIKFRDFYARRVRHLLPAALVVVMITLVASYVMLAPLDRSSVALDAASVGLLASNIRFALAEGDYFASQASPSPFLHFWALAVEAQFYLVWPVILLVACLGRRLRLKMMLALGAVVFASLALSVVVTEDAANWAFYSLPTRAWQFALGGIVAVGVEALGRIPRPILAVAGWCGLAVLLAAAVVLDGTVPYPGALALIPTLAALAMIAAGMTRGGPGRLLTTRPLRFLGRISYSLYLWHWPILVLPVIAFEEQVPPAVTAGLVALAVGVAWSSWRYVEQPFQPGHGPLARSSGRTVVAAGLAVALVVALSGGLAIGADVAAGPSLDDTATLESQDWADVDPGGGTFEPTPDARPDPDAPGGDLTPPTEAPSPGSTEPAGLDDESPIPVPSAWPTPSGTAAGRPQPTKAPRLSIRLPSDVRPPLRAARLDEDRLRGDGCLAFERVTEPRRCVYGDPKGAVTIALVGDSHAAHWFPALNRLAKRHDWRLLTYVKVACPFVDMRVRNLILKREYTECAAWRKATIKALQAERPDLTIVSMSRFAIHPVLDADSTLAAKGDALARALERVPGRPAVLVDTPDAGRDIPACLSRHSDDVRKCAIPRATALAGHLGRIELRATKATGDRLIDLTDRVCRGYPCPVVVDGMIVFRDARHLTATYAASLAPDLDRAIASALAAAP